LLSAQLSAFGRPEEVVELVATPEPGDPGPGEVIVEAEFCPINPADLLMLEGDYGSTRPPLPLIPGGEGVGRVVRLGGGIVHLKLGDRVLLPGPGTWRARCRVSAKVLFALPSTADARQLSMLRVNPPTAWLMLRAFVAPAPGQWVIQNAANSGVGHCLVRLARDIGLKTLNVVRRPELVEPLRAFGADVVLVDGPDLVERVRATIGGGRLPLAIDAVGGSATQRLARCIDEGGTVVNYGMQGGEPCSVDSRDTVFRDISLRGFWLRRWLLSTPPEQVAVLYRELAAKVAAGSLAVEIEADYPISRIREALAHAARGGRSGKILLSFDE